LVHRCIPRLSHGANKEACRAGVKELVAAPKREASEFKPQKQTKVKNPVAGGCLTIGPHQLDIDGSFQDHMNLGDFFCYYYAKNV
jgi:hypothetical protein